MTAAALLLFLTAGMSLAPLPTGVAVGMDISKLRQLARKNNVSCILVFGDSSVDPGNNNILPTRMKGNFPPYGLNFFGGRSTGRFSDGRLATDFIGEAIGYTKVIPGFLDPALKKADLPHGVSFASAASGYDDFTANLSSVISLRNQLKYFMHYKIHMGKLVGKKAAEEIIRSSVVVMSMGTNDFIQNYYLDQTRPSQYTIEEYQNFLITCMSSAIEVIHKLGTRKLVIVGVPPIGCMPLVRTLMDTTSCYEEYNRVSATFNSKIKHTLKALGPTLAMKTAYVDAYGIIQKAIDNPKKYGLIETSKGCCGTGTVEYGESCRGLSTCKDPTKYVFWDAVHPTEKMYKILANEAIASLATDLLS
ncbi:hypothetical protein SAY87_022296 [Trapa incisa]|uniref:GDSL esterase/lipase n=1 Tax=Trapa incisa TaxID=236973 RepID=A0AAN7K1L5_9MYRT|nr:hypothetical protein SAY87_022296 [Trapa incisa]